MLRRDFLLLSAAVTLAPPMARAAGGTPYSPGLVERLLGEGRTVFVDFYTTWCTTCRAQGRAITALRAENPAYDAAIAFVDVDWDIHAGSALARGLAVPGRSTLVALKGGRELGRLVAVTDRGAIRGLLDTALAAAGAG
ncbi:MAG: thioredoxin family protein [Rhodobacteraceae bacterium]|jgi:thiol-disulfide isomerase/thioredoxin|nr:thioredoxin family protein [Paracoccaceae bacterium]